MIIQIVGKFYGLLCSILLMWSFLWSWMYDRAPLRIHLICFGTLALMLVGTVCMLLS